MSAPLDTTLSATATTTTTAAAPAPAAATSSSAISSPPPPPHTQPGPAAISPSLTDDDNSPAFTRYALALDDAAHHEAPLDASQGRRARLARPSAAPRAAELARVTMNLRAALREFEDFPKPGITFVDILPLFAQPDLHAQLLQALELQITLAFPEPSQRPDVIVGLDARGFLFGPGLALRLGCGFAPVRKAGKLPGKTVEVPFEKEYGTDTFALQVDAVKPGQTVLVVDDIIATGGSAAAAGELVQQLGGKLVGFLFILELDFLKGRDKLQAPAITLLRDTKSS